MTNNTNNNNDAAVNCLSSGNQKERYKNTENRRLWKKLNLIFYASAAAKCQMSNWAMKCKLFICRRQQETKRSTKEIAVYKNGQSKMLPIKWNVIKRNEQDSGETSNRETIFSVLFLDGSYAFDRSLISNYLNSKIFLFSQITCFETNWKYSFHMSQTIKLYF